MLVFANAMRSHIWVSWSSASHPSTQLWLLQGSDITRRRSTMRVRMDVPTAFSMF